MYMRVRVHVWKPRHPSPANLLAQLQDDANAELAISTVVPFGSPRPNIPE
jgi:hypothetical protein